MLLFVLIASGGLILGPLDLQQVINNLLPLLQATRAADLEYWTLADLYEWADEAAKILARSHGVFVERDATGVLTAALAIYALPARHLSTIHVNVGTMALFPMTVQEAEALDATWPDTQAPAGEDPKRFLGDAAGTDNVRLYPTPSASGKTLDLLFHRFPPQVTVSNFLLQAPVCLAPYFAWRILAEARRRESKAKMPEVVSHFDERIALMDTVIGNYWGGAQ